MRAFYALFIARNREFLRDRGTLAWNFVFPFVAVFALAMIFSGGERELYKVALVGGAVSQKAGGNESSATALIEHAPISLRTFLSTRHVQFVPVPELETAQDKVRHHQVDMVLALEESPRYWVNPSNPKGYFLERVLWGSGSPNGFKRGELTGREIRYVDWLLPGILGMNLMFSCLWGVGYVIVRYRKGLILRRLKASPITALQFIAAQIASRMILVMFVTTVLYFGMDLVLDFFLLGSVIDLFIMFALGAVCHIALGILIASRTQSQELAGGILNLATWPMMFLSGVWFSLEGSQPWLVWLAEFFPLTHLVNATRRILLDGAPLVALWPDALMMVAMTVVFLLLGSLLFRWE